MTRLLSQDPVAVFSDFDGTIAHPDTLNHLTELFAGVDFRRSIAEKLSSGELSLREGIRLEVESIRGSLEDVLNLLSRDVTIDSTFVAFAQWCREIETPLTVLSGGMQQVIENLLLPYELSFIQILANRVHINQGQWQLEFRDDTSWGHDKGAAIRSAREAGYATIFVGDGLSDRGAAMEADLVFAKSGLARFCTAEKIPFEPFTDFSEIHDAVIERMKPGRPSIAAFHSGRGRSPKEDTET